LFVSSDQVPGQVVIVLGDALLTLYFPDSSPNSE